MFRLATLVVLFATIAPRAAEASLCELETFTPAPPIGCPFIINKRAADPITMPTITARRGDQDVTLSAQLTSATRTTFDVPYSRVCGDETLNETRTEPYDVLELSLPDVQVGDELFIDGRSAGTVVDAAACHTPWAPWCYATDTIDCPEDEPHAAEDDVGCNVGGDAGGALGLVFVMAALLRRRARH